MPSNYPYFFSPQQAIAEVEGDVAYADDLAFIAPRWTLTAFREALDAFTAARDAGDLAAMQRTGEAVRRALRTMAIAAGLA